MTRKQRIQAAKAFTEREGGLEALAEHQLYYLADYYIEASAQELFNKGVIYNHFDDLDLPEGGTSEVEYLRKRIWAFNGDGIATTEF